eukprot:scaffold726_cov262-Pinguiococcus_pyrenoidosus.AAC.5
MQAVPTYSADPIRRGGIKATTPARRTFGTTMRHERNAAGLCLLPSFRRIQERSQSPAVNFGKRKGYPWGQPAFEKDWEYLHHYEGPKVCAVRHTRQSPFLTKAVGRGAVASRPSMECYTIRLGFARRSSALDSGEEAHRSR